MCSSDKYMQRKQPFKKLKGDMVINCNYAAVDVDFSYINAKCSSGERTTKGF